MIFLDIAVYGVLSVKWNVRADQGEINQVACEKCGDNISHSHFTTS